MSAWAERTDLSVAQIDEAVIGRFRDDHLARCDCRWPTRSDRGDAGAALGHLLLVLRTLGVAAPSTAKPTPVDEELRRFEEHMDQVRGLAPKTRQAMLRIVRELLWGRFHARPVVISAITPEYVRRFFARLSERYHTPASAGSPRLTGRVPRCVAAARSCGVRWTSVFVAGRYPARSGPQHRSATRPQCTCCSPASPSTSSRSGSGTKAP